MTSFPEMQTGVLGDVEPPDEATLSQMHQSGFVLHAREGKITQVPAERCRLPHDPDGHPQGANVSMAADGTVYVAMSDKICKSTDGGRSWTSFEHREPRLSHFNRHCGAAPGIKFLRSRSNSLTPTVRITACFTWAVIRFCVPSSAAT